MGVVKLQWVITQQEHITEIRPLRLVENTRVALWLSNIVEC